MTEWTPRFALPLLQAGQAQKEILHNEAVLGLELLAQAIVETVGENIPPGAPADGACWIVGSAPGGAWAGHARALAAWTGGGWLFLAATEGMAAYVRAARLIARYRDGAWITGEAEVAKVLIGREQVVGPRQPAIAAPAGGATIDAEARTTLSLVLVAMCRHGLIAT